MCPPDLWQMTAHAREETMVDPQNNDRTMQGDYYRPRPDPRQAPQVMRRAGQVDYHEVPTDHQECPHMHAESLATREMSGGMNRKAVRLRECVLGCCDLPQNLGGQSGIGTSSSSCKRPHEALFRSRLRLPHESRGAHRHLCYMKVKWAEKERKTSTQKPPTRLQNTWHLT